MELTGFQKYFTKSKSKALDGNRYGTFYGVFLPGTLAMFGVILYLRFSWIIGSIGLTQTMIAVSFSCLVILITALSICSAATNTRVGGGGTYFMISRSLGIEAGSATGIPLFIAQALAVSFCTVGFAESIQPFFPDVPTQYLGMITLTSLMLLVYISSSIALKSQLIVFITIGVSLGSLFLGKPIPLDPAGEIMPPTIPFWTAFALFFPATTGVECGVAMSGNLKTPTKSIPFGSIAVVIVGFSVYFILPFFLSSYASRAQLVSNPLVLHHIARFQPLITVGIWAAILSSILGGLLGAPQTLRALASDRVFPKLLAKGWGEKNDPHLATALCFCVSTIGVLYGNINMLAPVLTMFYLITYAILNLGTGLEGLLNNPSWRPTFYVHWSISMLGVVLCLFAMFMIDAGATFIALSLVVLIYMVMKRRNLTENWEDIRHGVLLYLSRFAIYQLSKKTAPARSWRPNFLVLSSNPMQVGRLLNITSAISQKKGFLTLASVFPPTNVMRDKMQHWKKMVGSYLQEEKIEALVEFCVDSSLLSGAKKLLVNYGMESIAPNTLVLGEMQGSEVNLEYLEVIREAYLARKNVVIIKENFTNVKFSKLHIWWDDSSKASSGLMVLLGHMLQANRQYRRSQIHINSLVLSETAREQRQKYFDDFAVKRRLFAQTNVYINDLNHSSWKIMAEKSKDADVVLIGMPPPQEDTPIELFAQTYYEIMQNTKEIPNAVFVMCSKDLDVYEILTSKE